MKVGASPRSSSPQAGLKHHSTLLTALRPSFPHSSGAAVRPGMRSQLPRKGSLEKKSFVQSRPQALEHNERKPGNPAAGPSALGTETAWQSQAQGEERGCQARGQREKLQVLGVHAWGTLPQIPPRLSQLSKQQPSHSRGNRSLHTPSPCSLGNQTPSPFLLLLLPDKDPVGGPESPRSPPATHQAPCCLHLCSPRHTFRG